MDQIKAIEVARIARLKNKAPKEGAQAMVCLLARVIGIGIETADMLVHEALSRNLRDRRAVARYAGLTGSPDESGKRRREKGLARAGNTRVRRGMIQLAWRFLLFQENSALAQWFPEANGRRPRRQTQDHDCGSRSQIAGRAVASGDDRRNPTRCYTAPADMSRRGSQYEKAQVRDGAVFDLAVVAIRLPQQIAGIGFVALANLRDVDVHCGYTMYVYYRFVDNNNLYISGYILGI
jgi:hypothetical protein